MRDLSKYKKVYLAILDVLLINVAAIAGLYLRFEFDVPANYLGEYLEAAPYFTLISLGVFFAMGLYSVILRYASVDQLLASAASAVLSCIALWVIIRYLKGGSYPRSAIIITGLLEFLFIGGLRVSVRVFNTVLDGFIGAKKPSDESRVRVLVVGAGDAGVILGRELSKPASEGYKLVGYVDDDPAKKNTVVCGAKVYGDRNLIPSLVEQLGVDEVIIAMPSVSPSVVREIVTLCENTRARIRVLPRVLDMTGKPFDLNMVREVDIEDLLGRPEVQLDVEKIQSYLRGKKVLVTGAGGSIGQEICRQVASYSPSVLILLGHGENSLFEAKLSLDSGFPDTVKEVIVADVRDALRIKEVFATYKPDVVFHAAAHKHVPLMEDNVQEAVKTNIFGTYNVASASALCGAKKFVMISTDKAVNPTSVMGATKRVAEMVVQSMNLLNSGTQFVSVRFGNVLGSRGSVVPVFRRQIAQGGPVTVTHPDMTRYFMTIREAVELVLQAGTMGHGGEIFVLDMGEPVRILDMAEQMIRLSGRTPYTEIPIVFTGVRKGEKLYEEILSYEEGVSATQHSQILVAKQNGFCMEAFLSGLAKLERLVFPDNTSFRIFDEELGLFKTQTDQVVGSPSFGVPEEGILEVLRELVPEFNSSRVKEEDQPYMDVESL